MYMRNNIVELMPDPLTPLFATLGRRIINVEMGRLLNTFFGKPGIAPEELIVTVNDYAYYNGAFTFGQIVRILWGSVGIMKRMFTGTEQRWRDAHSRYVAAEECWQAVDWCVLPAPDILDGVAELFGEAIAYYGASVSGVIPGAWISESLFTVAYERLIKRRDDPAAMVYLLGFDSSPILGEKALYDLAEWTRTHSALAAHLSRTPAARLAEQLVAVVPVSGWDAWRDRFLAYLQKYGATIYDLDFAKPTPADDPVPLLEAFKMFLDGRGSDPHARQRAAVERRERATQAILNRLKGLRLRVFRKTLALAQKYAPLRESSLADIGLGYPLLRRMLLEIGQRLVRSGVIKEAADIFWLVEEDIRQAIDMLAQSKSVPDWTERVRHRKAVWRAEKRVIPPVSLPDVKGLGTKLLPKRAQKQARGLIKGIPCSAGSVDAIARVLYGPEDFGEMRPGDVLVAAITTPAWTPLFAMASAIVTDVGGPLSHGSIVAREYGIPAVLGTEVATRRIKTGDRVHVDGDRGLVEILD
jgi:pyruvate,water dikinase